MPRDRLAIFKSRPLSPEPDRASFVIEKIRALLEQGRLSAGSFTAGARTARLGKPGVAIHAFGVTKAAMAPSPLSRPAPEERPDTPAKGRGLDQPLFFMVGAEGFEPPTFAL